MFSLLALTLCLQAPAPVYFVDAQGDDTTAVVDDPTKPYATIQAATKAASPTGAPVHASILFERGDSFPGVVGVNLNTAPVPLFSGTGPDTPFTLGAYGVGPRPVIELPPGTNQSLLRQDWQHARIADLDFYAKSNDPAVLADVQPTLPAVWHLNISKGVKNVEFANCRWRFAMASFSKSKLDSADRLALRRCMFLDAYPVGGGHMSGLYAFQLALDLDQSILDHGGWHETLGSGATIYNHGAYLAACAGTRVTGCTFLRPSSIGLKITANSLGVGDGWVIDDNLFMDGEIALSIGGNVAMSDRFVEPTVTNNVAYEIGKNQPTGRNMAWGFNVNDWVGGTFASNLMYQTTYAGGNTFFLWASGSQTDLLVADNVSAGVKTPNGVIRVDGGPAQKIRWTGNTFDVASGLAVAYKAPMVNCPDCPACERCGGWDATNRFSFPVEPRPATVVLQQGKKPADSDVLLSLSGTPVAFAPTLPVDVLPLPWDEFVAAIREQGATGGEWNPSLSAAVINEKARVAFGVRKAEPKEAVTPPHNPN